MKIELIKNIELNENIELLDLSSSNKMIINNIIADDDEFEKIDVADVENLNDDELIDLLKLICTINYFKGSINENIYDNVIVELYKRFNNNNKYLLYLNLCCLKYDIFLFSDFIKLNELNIDHHKIYTDVEFYEITEIKYLIENYDKFENINKFDKLFDNLMYLSNYHITNYILYELLVFEKNDTLEQYFNIDEFIDDTDEFIVVNDNYNEIIVDYNISENY